MMQKTSNKLVALAILIFILAGFTSGCTNDKVVEKPVFVEKPPLVLPALEPVQQLPFEWTLITKANVDQKLKELENKSPDGQAVLLALTPEGYQALVMDINQLRIYIQKQRALIDAMKLYYMNTSKDDGNTAKK